MSTGTGHPYDANGALAALLSAARAKANQDSQHTAGSSVRDLARNVAGALDDVLGPLGLWADILADEARANGIDVNAAQGLHQGREQARQLTAMLRAIGQNPITNSTTIRLDGLLESQIQSMRGQHGDRITLRLDAAGTTGSPEIAVDKPLCADLLHILFNYCAHLIDGSGRIDAQLWGYDLDASQAATLQLPTGPSAHLMLRIQADGRSRLIDLATDERYGDTVVGSASKTSQSLLALSWAALHNLVQAHGGRVLGNRLSEQQADIHVALPAACSGIAKASSAKTPGKGRVLIVDDERLIRYAIVRVLEAHGFATEAVDDADQAMQCLATDGSAYDLVLLDLTMPGPSGLSCAQTLASQYPDLPVILMSGMPGISERDIGRGIRRVLEKPFLSPELIATVTDLIGSTAHAAEQT